MENRKKISDQSHWNGFTKRTMPLSLIFDKEAIKKMIVDGDWVIKAWRTYFRLLEMELV